MSQYCISISIADYPWDIVDTLELCSFQCGGVSIVNLQRRFDTLREHEESDFEDKTSTEDEFIQSIYDEIEYRMNIMGDAYPFYFSECSGYLIVKELVQFTDGSYVYLFCLILSTYKRTNISVTNKDRTLFESCVIVASAGEFTANSCHFGFPRSNNTGFLGRLKEIFEDNIGDGVVHTSFPNGVNPHQKDGKIDVIAWPLSWSIGHPIFLIQAAAGENWKSKPYKPFHDITKLQHWFSKIPVSKIMDCLAIPFDLSPDYNGTREDIMSFYVSLYGPILCRFTIPKSVDIGVNLLSSASIIEHIDQLKVIESWVIARRSQIGACA